jgi:hypothetical protein
MALDYVALRTKAKAVLKDTFGAVPCKVHFLDGTCVSSFVVFDAGEYANVDSRQNPTTIGALAKQIAYLPGDLGYDPDVGTRIEYKIGTTTYKKRVDKFNAITPATVPVLYELTLVNG